MKISENPFQTTAKTYSSSSYLFGIHHTFMLVWTSLSTYPTKKDFVQTLILEKVRLQNTLPTHISKISQYFYFESSPKLLSLIRQYFMVYRAVYSKMNFNFVLSFFLWITLDVFRLQLKFQTKKTKEALQLLSRYFRDLLSTVTASELSSFGGLM